MGKNNAHKTCFSKTRYDTKEIAEQEADRIYFESSTILYSYKCPLCGGYHLTHKKGRK